MAMDEVTKKKIAERAYHKYLQRGGKHGNDHHDWYEAEKEEEASKGALKSKKEAKKRF